MAMADPTPPPAEPEWRLPVVVTMTQDEAHQLIGEIAAVFGELGLDRSEGQMLESLAIALSEGMRS